MAGASSSSGSGSRVQAESMITLTAILGAVTALAFVKCSQPIVEWLRSGLLRWSIVSVIMLARLALGLYPVYQACGRVRDRLQTRWFMLHAQYPAARYAGKYPQMLLPLLDRVFQLDKAAYHLDYTPDSIQVLAARVRFIDNEQMIARIAAAAAAPPLDWCDSPMADAKLLDDLRLYISDELDVTVEVASEVMGDSASLQLDGATVGARKGEAALLSIDYMGHSQVRNGGRPASRHRAVYIVLPGDEGTIAFPPLSGTATATGGQQCRLLSAFSGTGADVTDTLRLFLDANGKWTVNQLQLWFGLFDHYGEDVEPITIDGTLTGESMWFYDDRIE